MIVRGVAKRHDVETAGGSVGQWWTPLPVARRACELAGVKRGTRVLELGAGVGNIARAAISMGAEVTAVELDPAHEDALRRVVDQRGQVVIGDVFTVDLWPHDVVVMNPPWERKLELRFLLRALELAPIVAAVVSADALHSGGRAELARMIRVRHIEHCVPRVIYARGGGQEETNIVVASRRVRPRAPGERDECTVGWFDWKAGAR